MFDGVPEQFHQFIRSNSQSSLPLHHLPFPNNTPFLDPSLHHHQFHQLVQHNNLLHPLHSSSSSSKHEEKQENNTNNTTLPLSFEIIDEERDHDHQKQQLPELIDPWSNEEVLTLLRIRSSMDSWFPERTWEHISRKMAEVGYKRSAEKCKEKFEEESRFFTNNINNNNNNNYGKSSSSTSYRFLSELEELYHHQEVVVESDQKNHHQNNNNHASDEGKKQQEEEVKIMDHHALGGEEEGDLGKVNTTSPPTTKEERSNNNKRKRGGGGRFEMFKGYCESIVHKMMEQQEEMHNKLIEDMVRWDEEKFAREEAWKRQEIERMNKELDIMAQEQAIAGDRHASIVDFLTKFAPQIQDLGLIGGRDKLVKVTTNNVNGSNTELHSHQNPNPSSMENSLQPTNSISVAKENPSSSGTHHAQDTLLQVGIMNPSSSSSLVNNDPIETNSSVANKATTTEKDDIGRRWPKDEVLALINLRCTTQNNNNNNEDNSNKEGNNNNNKAPLWERISQGMMELGYKRSAKRCKEKWENINKYFRKTKDVNKKRSLDSRTCPYFHYLTNLYSQGKLVLQPPERSQKIIPAQMHQIPSVVIDNNQNQTQLVDETTSSQVGSGGEGLSVQKVDHGGEKTLMQVPSLDFDQF